MTGPREQKRGGVWNDGWAYGPLSSLTRPVRRVSFPETSAASSEKKKMRQWLRRASEILGASKMASTVSLERVVSLGSLGRFSDDEDSLTSSTSGDDGAVDRLRPPGRFGRQSEAEDWSPVRLIGSCGDVGSSRATRRRSARNAK